MLNIQNLILVLKQEQSLQSRHCQILEAQQRALLACDRRRFSVLETEHAELLSLLEKHSVVRHAALTDENGAALTVTELLDDLDGHTRRTLENLRDSLRQTLERIGTISERNEMLIRNELNYLAFTLDLFVEAGRNASQRYGGYAVLGGWLGLDRRG